MVLYGDAESSRRLQKTRSDMILNNRSVKILFFQKSYLSINQIAMFCYLWPENVSQSFIQKQINIAQQSVFD